MNQHVSFFLPLEAPGSEAVPDPDAEPSFYCTGRRAWVAQTFFRLRQRDFPVGLCHEIPGDGLVVLHADKKSTAAFLAARPSRRLVSVVTCADRQHPRWADFRIVQNGSRADRRRTFFVPHWPQAGLQPRSPDRRLTTVAFKGQLNNLHPMFRGQRWLDYLKDRGLSFQDDSAPYLGSNPPAQDIAWHDFREVDLFLAVRPNLSLRYHHKPATKLVNAWMAGVPALLGPEYAYQEMRRSELDYVEVTSLEEAMAGVDRLLDDPGLYRAMVDNGRRRAAEFHPDRIAERWVELLFDTFQTGRRGLWRWVPHRWRL